jgi:hypothetical protein
MGQCVNSVRRAAARVVPVHDGELPQRRSAIVQLVPGDSRSSRMKQMRIRRKQQQPRHACPILFASSRGRHSKSLYEGVWSDAASGRGSAKHARAGAIPESSTSPSMVDGDWQFNKPHAAVFCAASLAPPVDDVPFWCFCSTAAVSCAARRNVHISLQQLVLVMH